MVVVKNSTRRGEAVHGSGGREEVMRWLRRHEMGNACGGRWAVMVSSDGAR